MAKSALLSAERWPALLRPPEAASYLGVSETVVKQLRGSELIMSVRIPGTSAIRYRRSDLDRFIENLPEGIGQLGRGGGEKKGA